VALCVALVVIDLPVDLSCCVDALCKGLSSRGKIEGGEGAPAVEKAVRTAIGVFELPDDLARVVDAGGDGGARRFGEGGEGAPAVEEAVLVATGVKVHPDDLARVVDAACIRAAGA